MKTISAGTTWLFDLGNSSLKGTWSRGEKFQQVIGIGWDVPDFVAGLRKLLLAWPAPDRILVASVVSSERAALLREALQTWPRVSGEWLRSPRQGCGVVNSYREPERLGVDRFLAMAAARAAANGAPVIVAGCGTALTLDAVDARGVQREGLIAPSPDLMMRALRQDTAIGDTNPDAFVTDDPFNIDDSYMAIQVGCSRAAAALVASYHAQWCKEFGEASLWLHGGGALTMKTVLDQYHDMRGPQMLDAAVLNGLAIWAAQDPA